MNKDLNAFAFEDQALLIASEIFDLTNAYTNDSHLSKFFLTDEVADSCYALAGGFAAMIYTPELDPEDIQETQILSFVYALITYGFNIYLKERSLRTNASPYTLPADKKKIKQVQKQILALTSKGELLSTPLSIKIIDIIIDNIQNKISLQGFRVKGHKINRQKFLDYSKLSLYWGYNFARGLLGVKLKTTART